MIQLQPTLPSPQTLRQVFENLSARLWAALPGVLLGAIVFLIFWLVASIGRRLIAVAAPRAKADTGAVLLLSRVYYYGVLSFGLVTALGAAGLNVSALIAGLGLTGFALGFALKDVLSNLLSGIMLLLYRPFNIGDQIEMGEHAGVIETIRMRDTLVRADDGRLIIIPNTKLITEVVINHTARDPSSPAAAAARARPRVRQRPAAPPGEPEDDPFPIAPPPPPLPPNVP